MIPEDQLNGHVDTSHYITASTLRPNHFKSCSIWTGLSESVADNLADRKRVPSAIQTLYPHANEFSPAYSNFSRLCSSLHPTINTHTKAQICDAKKKTIHSPRCSFAEEMTDFNLHQLTMTAIKDPFDVTPRHGICDTVCHDSVYSNGGDGLLDGKCALDRRFKTRKIQTKIFYQTLVSTNCNQDPCQQSSENPFSAENVHSGRVIATDTIHGHGSKTRRDEDHEKASQPCLKVVLPTSPVEMQGHMDQNSDQADSFIAERLLSGAPGNRALTVSSNEKRQLENHERLLQAFECQQENALAPSHSRNGSETEEGFPVISLSFASSSASQDCSPAQKSFESTSNRLNENKYHLPSFWQSNSKGFDCNDTNTRQDEVDATFLQACKCRICQHQFKSVFSLNFHIYKVHERTTRPSCMRCSTKLMTLYSLFHHLKKHERLLLLSEAGGMNEDCHEQRELQPPLSIKTLGSKFQRHSRTPTLKGKLLDRDTACSSLHHCGMCGLKYQKKKTLVAHVRSKHSGLAPRRHRCGQCPRSFSSRWQLDNHWAWRHQGWKPYACAFCGQGFVSRPTLVRHQRKVHTGEKPYRCCHCDETFFEKVPLDLHKAQMHTGIFPYVCGQCGRGFVLPSFLRNHQKIHTGLRPYKCTACGKQYSKVSHLKRHLVSCDKKAAR